MRYCGRTFTAVEIEGIRQIITSNQGKNRAALSRMVCETFSWRKPDGGLKDMSCRVAMLRMQADGLICLPPPQRGNGNGKTGGRRTPEAEPGFPVNDSVENLIDLQLQLVKPKTSPLWNEYVARYHYLGYTPLPGAQLRYFITANRQVLALLGFGAAAWKTAPRDQFIGWTAAQRERNLHRVINNARFLILPWVTSRNLASKVLALAAKRLPDDWQQRYQYRPALLETFVEIQRFHGTCYKAANWICVGKTKGRGKLDRYNKAKLPVKNVWVLPLAKNFRQLLCS